MSINKKDYFINCVMRRIMTSSFLVCDECSNTRYFENTLEGDVVCTKCGLVVANSCYNSDFYSGPASNLSFIPDKNWGKNRVYYLRSNHFNQILLAWGRCNPEFVIPYDIWPLVSAKADEYYRTCGYARFSEITKRDIQRIYRMTEIPLNLQNKYQSHKFACRPLKSLTDRKQFCLRWWEVKDKLMTDHGEASSIGPIPSELLLGFLRDLYKMFIKVFEVFRHSEVCDRRMRYCHKVYRCRYGAPNNFYILKRLLHLFNVREYDDDVEKAINLSVKKRKILSRLITDMFNYLHWPESLSKYIDYRVSYLKLLCEKTAAMIESKTRSRYYCETNWESWDSRFLNRMAFMNDTRLTLRRKRKRFRINSNF